MHELYARPVRRLGLNNSLNHRKTAYAAAAFSDNNVSALRVKKSVYIFLQLVAESRLKHVGTRVAVKPVHLSAQHIHLFKLVTLGKAHG